MNTEIIVEQNTSTEAMIRSYLEQYENAQNTESDALLKKCRLYVSALECDRRRAKEVFQSKYNLSPSAWSRFEAIGRGKVHANLLGYFGRAFTVLSKLSVSDQEIATTQQLEYLTPNSGVLLVNLSDLDTASQDGRIIFDQIFGNGIIRNLAQQKQYREACKAKRIEDSSVPEQAYKIKGGRVYFSGPASYTVRELEKLLEQARAA